MAKVVAWEMIGDHYRNGYRYPGAVFLHLDNGQMLCFPNKDRGVMGPLDEADRLGHDTTEVRGRLAQS